MKKLFPDIALWVTEVNVLILFFSFFIGFLLPLFHSLVLPFVPVMEDCFCVLYLTEEFPTMVKDSLKGKRCN